MYLQRPELVPVISHSTQRVVSPMASTNWMGPYIRVFYDKEKGDLEKRQTTSTLPDDFAGENFCADIHVGATAITSMALIAGTTELFNTKSIR